MDQMPFSPFLISLLLTFSIIHPSASQQQCTSHSTTQVRAGHWLSNSNHYSPLSNINTSLYTHLYYYSLSLDNNNFAITSPPPDQLPLLTTFSATLKSNNPSLKTLLSIATDDQQTNASNAAFSSMAANPALRAVFINSTIDLARANQFDGLDLAWQFPSSSSDMANLGLLLAEWRARINEEVYNLSTPLLLTATVYFSDHLFDGPTDDLDYPIDSISSNLDWANAICFGYHKDSEVTATDAALYEISSHFSTSYGISSWLDAGIPPCKLVIGIPLYGRSWFLKNKMKNGLGAQVVAAGPRQKLSKQTGVMAYFEIEELLKETNSAYIYDHQTVSAYFHTASLWVSFDSTDVLDEKIVFALRNGLQGYFLWPISFDDSNYTVSKQALDVWLRKEASIGTEGENGSGQALSPIELQPRDGSPTQSADFSGSSFSTIHNFYMQSYLLLFLLYYLSTV